MLIEANQSQMHTTLEFGSLTGHRGYLNRVGGHRPGDRHFLAVVDDQDSCHVIVRVRGRC